MVLNRHPMHLVLHLNPYFDIANTAGSVQPGNEINDALREIIGLGMKLTYITEAPLNAVRHFARQTGLPMPTSVIADGKIYQADGVGITEARFEGIEGIAASSVSIGIAADAGKFPECISYRLIGQTLPRLLEKAKELERCLENHRWRNYEKRQTIPLE